MNITDNLIEKLKSKGFIQKDYKYHIHMYYFLSRYYIQVDITGCTIYLSRITNLDSYHITNNLYYDIDEQDYLINILLKEIRTEKARILTGKKPKFIKIKKKFKR